MTQCISDDFGPTAAGAAGAAGPVGLVGVAAGGDPAELVNIDLVYFSGKNPSA